MENREIFSGLKILPPVFVRLDGRAFHRLSRVLQFERPFDERFSEAMRSVCASLIRESGMSPDFAFTFSDEISLFFRHLPFEGRIEKIDSVCASYAASSLTLALRCRAPLAFDARILPAFGQHAMEYLIERQREAWRNHVNAYGQHALVGEGLTPREAAARLKKVPASEIHELLHARGINLARTPAWQRRGVLVYKELVEREGYNPLTQQAVRAIRSEVRICTELPLFGSPEGREFLRSLLDRP
ncbi:MAG: tRNA(His) guanylyltransferase Thg1 family protein [Methanomicrobiales archaeon]|nr:tRNA(His) guanylyltransferase Thg1 family protein [Methanomicrobiales archaeon]MDI6876127.1 tRNA(His) guanylyltransferase Thg1 family protein [Methanomicrobiales archaeon]